LHKISDVERLDYIAANYPCSSCKEIQDLDSSAPSGEYSLMTVYGKILPSVSIGFISHVYSLIFTR